MVQRAYAFPFYLLVGRKSFKQMIDSRILGERLRLIRTRLGLSQKQLAAAIRQTQPAISRLENGEEVYASVLLAALHFYQSKVSLDNLFAQDFITEDERLLFYSPEEKRQNISQQLDLMADIINEANEACLAQLTRLKKNIP